MRDVRNDYRVDKQSHDKYLDRTNVWDLVAWLDWWADNWDVKPKQDKKAAIVTAALSIVGCWHHRFTNRRHSFG